MQYLKEEVRNNILKAAREEFKQHGYSNASIRNIAQMSDTSLGNIYRYFTDKEAVFLTVVSDLIDSNISLVEKNFFITEQGLAAYPDILLDFNEKYKEEYLILKSGLRRHYFQYISALVKVYAAKMRDYMAATNPDVSIKIKSQKFYEDISHAFMHGLYHAQSQEGTREQRHQSIKELLWFFFAGLDKRFADIPD